MFLYIYKIFNTQNNTLSVNIESPLKAALDKKNAYPYNVPTSIYYNTWSEPNNRNFLRKSPKDFGWDWGPCFMPSGVTGDVYFTQKSNGFLHGLIVNYTLSDDFTSAHVSLFAHFNQLSQDVTNAKVQIFLNKKFQFNTTFNVTVDQSSSISSFENNTSELVLIGEIHLDAVKLWWPIGYGS